MGIVYRRSVLMSTKNKKSGVIVKKDFMWILLSERVRKLILIMVVKVSHNFFKLMPTHELFVLFVC